MRTLSCLFVACSWLILTPSGPALADASETEPTTTTKTQGVDAGAVIEENGVCKPRSTPSLRTQTIHPRGPAARRGDVVVLNTRGYNYRRPGEALPNPLPQQPSAPKPAAPAK